MDVAKVDLSASEYDDFRDAVQVRCLLLLPSTHLMRHRAILALRYIHTSARVPLCAREPRQKVGRSILHGQASSAHSCTPLA
jgi:hypothetical protein